MGTPAGFAPTKDCFKRSRWFGKRHKTDAFTKLGEPAIRAACTPQTVLDRRFWCLVCFSSIHDPCWSRAQEKRAYSALHPQALTECSPLDFLTPSVAKADMTSKSFWRHYHIHNLTSRLLKGKGGKWPWEQLLMVKWQNWKRLLAICTGQKNTGRDICLVFCRASFSDW